MGCRGDAARSGPHPPLERRSRIISAGVSGAPRGYPAPEKSLFVSRFGGTQRVSGRRNETQNRVRATPAKYLTGALALRTELSFTNEQDLRSYEIALAQPGVPGGEHVRPPPKAGRPRAERVLQMNRMRLVDLVSDDLPSTDVVALPRDAAGQVVAQRPAMEALERFDPGLGAAIRAVYEQRSKLRIRCSAGLERRRRLSVIAPGYPGVSSAASTEVGGIAVRWSIWRRRAWRARRLKSIRSCSSVSRRGCGLTVQRARCSSRPLKPGPP